MNQIAQQLPPAEILSFPQISRIDEQLLWTVLDNMSQGVDVRFGNAINILQ